MSRFGKLFDDLIDYIVDFAVEKFLNIFPGGKNLISIVDYFTGKQPSDPEKYLGTDGPAIRYTGNDRDEDISGSKKSDVIIGGLGKDKILAGDGDDEIIGGGLQNLLRMMDRI